MDKSDAFESQFIKEEKWLLENLKGKDGVLQVLKVKGEIATAKGDNFTSDIIRMKTQILLEDGQIKDRSYILKKQTTILDKIFDTEFRMYTEVLPKMEMLMKSKDKDAEVTWGKLICWNDDKTILVLEDLIEQGYIPSNRLVGLDIHDCLFIVRELGKFHALGVALIEKGEINVNDFRTWVLRENEQMAKNLISSGLSCLVKVMKEDWDQKEWGDVTRRLEALIPNCCDKFFKTFDDQSTSKSLKVLSHGDCWACNLMMKYSPATGAPKHVKFLDFQVSHVNSIAWDLTYFIHTSCKPDQRRQHWHHLLQTYLDSLTEGLIREGIPKERIPKMAELEEELRQVDYWAFLLVSTFLPASMAPPGQVFSLDHMNDATQKYTNLQLFKNPNMLFTYKKILRSSLKMVRFDIICNACALNRSVIIKK